MELEETDLAILRCLQEDARLSLRALAEKVGVSTPTVSARLGTLEELGIIRGYRAVVDRERLRETSLLLVVRTKLPAADAVASRIATFSWARRVTIARGGRILVDATLADAHEIDDVLQAVAAMPHVVDAEHHVIVRDVKERPPALLADRTHTNIACFECHGPIVGDPVKSRLDGREHFFCCRSCQRLYMERFTALAARASGSGPRGRTRRARTR